MTRTLNILRFKTLGLLCLLLLGAIGGAGAQTAISTLVSDTNFVGMANPAITYYGRVVAANANYSLFTGSNSEAVVVTHGTACIASLPFPLWSAHNATAPPFTVGIVLPLSL